MPFRCRTHYTFLYILSVYNNYNQELEHVSFNGIDPQERYDLFTLPHTNEIRNFIQQVIILMRQRSLFTTLN